MDHDDVMEAVVECKNNSRLKHDDPVSSPALLFIIAESGNNKRVPERVHLGATLVH